MVDTTLGMSVILFANVTSDAYIAARSGCAMARRDVGMRKRESLEINQKRGGVVFERWPPRAKEYLTTAPGVFVECLAADSPNSLILAAG